MSLAVIPGLSHHTPSTALEESIMTATYTFDIFSSLDGYGAAGGNWTGYWGKQGPELLDHRLALYGDEQRMVFGANTYRAFAQMLAESTEESEVRDPWVTRMRSLPATVVSTTLEEPLDWPNATVVSGDAVDVVARLKEESEVPLRSHGSLSLNRSLMGAGLVDRVQVTFFPSSPVRPGWTRSFRVRPTSTWSSSRAGRLTATSKSSSTGPPCMPESDQALLPVKQPNRTLKFPLTDIRSDSAPCSRGLLITS